MTDPRASLLAEQARLTALDVRPDDRRSTELSTVDQHPADEGSETFSAEADDSIAESVLAELDDVRAALRRLDEGTYGTCQACGRPIEQARLEVLPATRFCLDDARRAEEDALRSR